MPDVFVTKAPSIMRDLMHDLGFTVNDAAAVLGNIGHECGGFKLMQEQHPTVAGSLGGYGWCQWTGPRRRSFEAWCKSHNLSPDSDAGNYGYLLFELTSTEASAVPATKSAASLYDKVVAFESHFERAGVKHYDLRKGYADKALAAFNDSAPKPANDPVPIPIQPDPPKPAPAPLPASPAPVPASPVAQQPDQPASLWARFKSLFSKGS